MKCLFKGFLIAFLGFILINTEVFSQEVNTMKKPAPKKDFWGKVYFSGNFGLQFGNYTLIDLSPVIGYKVTDKFSLGTGPVYIYFKDKFYKYSTSIYGGKLFGRYLITENLFGHAEYEILNGEWDPFNNRRFNITNVWVGGGYRQAVGGSGALTVMALWNINESAFSPYQNPLIRVGFSVGF